MPSFQFENTVKFTHSDIFDWYNDLTLRVPRACDIDSLCNTKLILYWPCNNVTFEIVLSMALDQCGRPLDSECCRNTTSGWGGGEQSESGTPNPHAKIKCSWLKCVFPPRPGTLHTVRFCVIFGNRTSHYILYWVYFVSTTLERYSWVKPGIVVWVLMF